MTTRFKNKYRIDSSRLVGHDYSLPGNYFITICTWKKNPYFGKCQNGGIVLSELGLVLQKEWLKTPGIRKEMNISLDEYIIMPDHFHAIIKIGNCTKTMTTSYRNVFGPQSNNLGSVIRGLKSAVTSFSKRAHLEFGWQPGYHDRIIRSEYELKRIRKYIILNPKKMGDIFML
jgi:REP element-mobilizing transposase RayT